jgi:mRNA-degrading endonuclease RelE of RelBE toxin-antitoxin system
VDKIEKFLKKLSVQERDSVQRIIEKILSNNTYNLDIKQLKGEQNLFRVRKGSLRIVFLKDGADIRSIFIGRRDENTYKL